MIGQHPQLLGLPELNLFLADTIGETALFMKRRMPHGQDGLLRAIAELLFGGQSPEQVEKAKGYVSRQLSCATRQIWGQIVSACSPRGPVEKSPSTVLRLGSLLRLVAAAPGARFVHLTRHPLSFGTSLLAFAEQSKEWGRAIYGTRLDPERIWQRAHGTIADFCATLASNRSMHLRGEDLLGQPDLYLREIAEWLDVRSDPAAIESMLHPEFSPFSRRGPPNAPGGADPSFLDSPVLRPFNHAAVTLDDPAPWSGAPLATETVRLARQLGYR
jgi:hypothetical protein